jgi:hypothetical protein
LHPHVSTPSRPASAPMCLPRRQEALERELDRCNIRRAPLGIDRHHRRYWWGLAGLKSLVLVEHSDGVWSAIATPEQLDALIYSLDTRVREGRARSRDELCVLWELMEMSEG